MTNAIEVSGLAKTYGSVVAVDGISFEVGVGPERGHKDYLAIKREPWKRTCRRH